MRATKTASDYTIRKVGWNYGLYFKGSLVESGVFATRHTANKYRLIAEQEQRNKLKVKA